MKGHPVCFVCVNCQHQRGIATDRSTSLHSTCSVTFWMVTETLQEELISHQALPVSIIFNCHCMQGCVIHGFRTEVSDLHM